MLRKTIIATAALVLSGGMLAATTATADAHSRSHHPRYARIKVCEPIVRWHWNRHHHHRIRVVVGHDCHWVRVPQFRHHHHHRDHHARRY